MFVHKKISILLLILLLFTCGKSKKKDEPFEDYLKNASKEICQKFVSCNANIIRTFPKDLQKEVTVEVCQETLLVDFEEKLSLHTDSMKLLTKSCYEKILSANCTQYLALAYGDLSCYSLKKESNAVYSKVREKRGTK